MAKILAIEDEENLRLSIRRTLARSGHTVSEASCLSDARTLLEGTAFDLILTDVILGSENGLDLVKSLRAEGSDGLIVVMTAFGTVESAVQAMKVGADDYLQKPLSLEELSLQVDRWLEQQRVARRATLYERLERVREEKHNLVGASPAWQETVGVARRLAGIPLGEEGADGSLPTILLLGETGTGKGVLARFIHAVATGAANPAQAKGDKGAEGTLPFVHVNCSALPATLVEGELFGHEKGAFTDAREARPGLFEMADGGTIFLDEISEMPLELQAKLLLVVEQGTFRRVGGTKERHVRVRIIAASNQDLYERVEAGRFRRDLLYRLNTFTVTIPPLRERAGDAPLIAETVLERAGRRYGRADLTLSDATVAAITSHDWPGNVRELVNAVQRAAMLASTSSVEPSDLGVPPARAGATAPAGSHEPGTNGKLRFNFASGEHTADAVERMLIMQALEETRGNVSRAAKLIGMQRSSFRYRIERYRLEPFVSEVARR